ncbi:MAG: ABC transporter substrate-binding protein [Planctomycetes bacterium]|nr:ABC transporter substrate-binding protein [Planctomycetota bacterium]
MKGKSVLASLTVLLLVFFCLTSAFGGGQKGVDAVKKDVYNIGFISSLTGSYSVEALDQQRGALFAVEQINAAGGLLGRQLVMYSRDDEARAETGIRKADELKSKYNIIFACGGVSGLVSGAMGPWAARNQIPWGDAAAMFTATGARDFVSSGYFYTTGVSLFSNVNILGDIAFNKLGCKKVYLLGVDYAFGWGIAETVEAVVPRYGAAVVAKDFLPLGTTEFGPIMAKIKASGADSVFLANFGGDQIAALKAIQAFGLKENVKIFSTIATASIAKGAGPQAAEGVYFVLPYYKDSPIAEWKTFREAFLSRFDIEPGSYGTFAYNAVKMFARAMEGAGTTDFAKAGPWLMKNADFVGPAGKMRMMDVARTMMQDQTVVQGKAPKDITGEEDVFSVLYTIGYSDDESYQDIPPSIKKKMGY